MILYCTSTPLKPYINEPNRTEPSASSQTTTRQSMVCPYRDISSSTEKCFSSPLHWASTEEVVTSQKCIKALANEDTLLRTHCCSWCFLGCANLEIFVADTKCFWTKSETFFVSRTQNLCPQQMLSARVNGETFTCPQQRVRTNVSSFARAFSVDLPVTVEIYSWVFFKFFRHSVHKALDEWIQERYT